MTKMTTEEWMSEIDGPAKNFPGNWARIEEVRDAHIRLLEKEVNKFHQPQKEGGRGIVVAAGGAKYFACAFACFTACRRLGSRIPFEFWHLGKHEMDPMMQRCAESNGIRVVDAIEECKRRGYEPRILNGWELKPLSVMFSAFSEVLYLDADCIPVKNPDLLFEEEKYKKFGAAFWPDLPPSSRKEWLPPECWRNIGMKYQNSPDFETGQFMVDKSRRMRELSVANWMNQHSDYFYQFVFGDKSTFHLAWKKCKTEYAMPEKTCGWTKPCIVQNGFDGQPFFYHACQGKDEIVSGSMENHPIGPAVKQASEELRKWWSGHIYSWGEMNEREMAYAKSAIGTYEYSREGMGSRLLELQDEGRTGQGAGRCERRWSVTIVDGVPHIVAIGSAHKGSEIAMFMAAKKDDHYEGRWTAFEKNKCWLKPLREEK
jgi:hypothetical protein